MTQLKLLPHQDTSKLRIEFIHRATNLKKLPFKKHTFPVQNVPFELGVKVTNIDKSAFHGCGITAFQIYHTTPDVTYTSEEMPHVRALNPKESVDIYFDKYTAINEGPIWVSLELKSLTEDATIQAYQYDQNHDMDNICSKVNSWGNSYYVQGKLELLQANTNIQILILTIITVLEAIFGLKNILQGFFGAISGIFTLLAKVSGYFS